jgi:hypothetical protein
LQPTSSKWRQVRILDGVIVIRVGNIFSIQWQAETVTSKEVFNVTCTRIDHAFSRKRYFKWESISMETNDTQQ